MRGIQQGAATMPQDRTSLAWGAKLTPEERTAVFDIADSLGMEADHLMGGMAFETGETFSPSIRNAAGSGAVGLIQFMPATLKPWGITPAQAAKMTRLEQLQLVHRYFKPFRNRLKTLNDVYMAILWPAAVGKPDSHALWTSKSHPTTFRQNSGLDANKDRIITKGEAGAKVNAKLAKGCKAPYRWAA